MSETLEITRPQAKLRLRPLTPLLGAELTGIDLRHPLDAATRSAVRKALLDHKVLVFREQQIDDEQQIAFSRSFGRVTPAHPIRNGLVDAPEIMENILSRDGSEYAGFD